MVRFLVAVMFLAGTVLEPKSCSINFGGGSDNPSAPSGAGAWTGYDGVEHIISQSASVKGGSNYWTYHTQVAIGGSGSGGHYLPY
ncbi:MAG TPA: hypothetical protein VOA80_05165 [Thermoanaerobaculia bacterium]|nr:hypothetical protein [Thermoanaerobaculia bacterium]